jgi:hypothetical protein
MESTRYICSRHKVALELWTFDGFPYWQCPIRNCGFVKPCKSGRRTGKTRAEALSKIKAEIVRIGTNGSRQGHKFAERMFASIPELRRA